MFPWTARNIKRFFWRRSIWKVLKKLSRPFRGLSVQCPCMLIKLQSISWPSPFNLFRKYIQIWLVSKIKMTCLLESSWNPPGWAAQQTELTNYPFLRCIFIIKWKTRYILVDMYVHCTLYEYRIKNKLLTQTVNELRIFHLKKIPIVEDCLFLSLVTICDNTQFFVR